METSALLVYICVCPKYHPFSIAWNILRIPLPRMSFRGSCLVAPGGPGRMILRAFLGGREQFYVPNHNPLLAYSFFWDIGLL